MTLTKKEIAHKFFRDIKPKHLKCFEAETPKGNIIKGVICKKPNHYLGSMLIQKIFYAKENIEYEVEQFVQAMPKINYHGYKTQMYQEEEVYYNAYEKLDGSCLILYPLHYNGELIEVVPKTRGIPVADKHIIEMYNEIDHSNINEFFKQWSEVNTTLIFELYGTLNQRSIFYPRTRINIRLLGATDEGRFLHWHELGWICSQYDFKMPNKIFGLVFMKSVWRISCEPGLFRYYLTEGMGGEEIYDLFRKEYPTQIDVIQAIKDMITIINKNYFKKHNRSLLEGVVIDSYDSAGENFLYTKIKSAEIEERCRTENGVPRRFVLKEVQKYFDEYGSQAKEIYQKDENHVVDYVNKNLLEEFDPTAVEMKRTQSRIKNVFLDMLEAREPPKGLQDICNSLVEQYPNLEISDLMRLFAQEYPEKKRHARIAYSIFEKLV